VLFVGSGVGSSVHFVIPLGMDPVLSFQAWTLQGLSGTPARGFKLTNAVGIAIQ
jgi:hypothetical protein